MSDEPEESAGSGSAALVSAESLHFLAALWSELQRRGEDMSRFDHPAASFLPAIASGNLLPELLLQFGHTPRKFALFAQLSPADQAKLVHPDATVDLVIWDSGEARVVKKRPEDLTLAETMQLIETGDGAPAAEEMNGVTPLFPRERQRAPANDASGAAICSDDALFDLLGLEPCERAEIRASADARGETVADHVKNLCIASGIMRPDEPVG